MKREQVVRNQRARLYGAMIEAVARSGWQETTVAGVISLAGVSRRSFYEHFANREECLMATYDSIVARSRKLVIDAWADEPRHGRRAHAACQALFDDIASAPKPARLVLVDSLASGPAVREHMSLAAHTFERLVAFALSDALLDARLPPLTPRALVGGIRQLLFALLQDGRELQIPALTGEVLDWCESYRAPAAARLASAPSIASEAPPRPAPVAFLGGEDQRARAFLSLIHLTFDEGYARLTDAQVAQFAGISTAAFHGRFATKEDCLVALLDEICDDATRGVRERVATAGSWPESVRTGLAAFVQYLAQHEALARILFIEAFELGPAIANRLTRPVEELLRVLSAEAPKPRRGAEIARQAVTGAVWGILAGQRLNTLEARLPWLVDQLSFFVLAPYIGGEEAVGALEAARGAGSGR